MSWLSVGIGAGTALLGGAQRSAQIKDQQRAQAANMMANAAQMEYSPWTGMGKEMLKAQPLGTDSDVLMSGLEGGLAGFQFGKQFDKKPPKKEDLFSGVEKKYTGQGIDPSSIA